MREVFISSVVGGFEAYRTAARKTIISMGDKPIGCEDFGARAYSSERACITEAENADIYLLIMGERYGSETDEGISVTQAEFRAAKRASRPILVFIRDCEMEPKQKAFKKEVEDYKSGFFRAAFSDIADLKDEITKALRQLAETRKAAPDSEFAQRIEKATVEILGSSRSSRNDPMFVLAFWPQPMQSIDLAEIGEELAEKFTTMGRNRLVVVKEGYDDLHGRKHVGLKSRDNRLVYFEDGLVLLGLDPIVEREGFHFTSYYVPPTRLRELASGAAMLFTANGGWCHLELRGMEMAHVHELPEKGTSSMSMGMRSEEDSVFSAQKLFIPFQSGAYLEWVESQIKRMQRAFSTR